MSKKYYLSERLSEGKNETQISRPGTRRNNTVVITGGPSPTNSRMTSSTDKIPLRDHRPQIVQSTEVMVAIELRKTSEGDNDGHGTEEGA
jgi:hypothetical protein